MKFSIRDLLLVTVIVALAVGWGLDRFGLAKQNHLLLQLLREERGPVGLASPPKAGSKEAMTAFLSVVKKVHSSRDLEMATNLCFIEGSLAAPYKELFAAADHTCAPFDSQFPAGIQYEFWTVGTNPRENGNCYVRVVATGNPLIIVRADVVEAAVK